MMPDWIRDIFFWFVLFCTGYGCCWYKLEKKYEKKLLLQTDKFKRKIRSLKEKT